MKRVLFLVVLGTLAIIAATNAQSVRKEISLNDHWKTIAGKDEAPLAPAFKNGVDDRTWNLVQIPHNWDDYYGYRRLLHGNKHGDSWYRKTFQLKELKSGKRFFLFFEGVDSYATVYLNEKKVGEHAGGRTSFTLDVTDQIKSDGSMNLLAVRAWHPPFIKDLPWVCGGCSDERGFSEGSQPMGIFRPVHLIVTDEVRIEPFGVHVWANVQPNRSFLNSDITIKNYGIKRNENIVVRQELLNKENNIVASISKGYRLKGADSIIISNRSLAVKDPVLWSIENPYLYKLKTTIRKSNRIIDEVITDFGFRTINWQTSSHQFFLNGKPVFINGVAEYEHLIGQSHAFSQEQIQSRVKWIEAAGFNSFRDGHQPHNLLYGKLFNQKGILWWTQFSAHVWYDTPEFRKNFKDLLREWVIERRNDPSVIMWGLQNESTLPGEFAQECTKLIRSLDPTTSSQRWVTTCNGGEGTDWNVPQNWTGTYGGNPDAYGEDLKKQVLVGEYGAWRTLDLHTEGGFQQNGLPSEDRFAQLMEKKIRLAESVKDSVAGHYFWLLTSHDNPGRVQGGEGFRELDRIGPVNYKGMLTPWEEPTDVFYMYRSNYVPAAKGPMVYISSHTWPNRWLTPGTKESITVYSNCDEVELFNDLGGASLGKRKRAGIGSHFSWDQVNIQYNILYAEGIVKGKVVAKDTLVWFHLPASPHFNRLFEGASQILKPGQDLNYLVRVNCGGGDYLDEYGNHWQADRTGPYFDSSFTPEKTKAANEPYWSAKSWTSRFSEMPAAFASQRRTFAPIKGTKDWELFQTFRYGKHDLQYTFPLPNGEYSIELYFNEPWIGIGGGFDGSGIRVFDVAFNDQVVLRRLDIWKEAGTNRALKKTVPYKVTNNQLVIHFPNTVSGQAVISAIAIATKNKDLNPVVSLPPVVVFENELGKAKTQSWLDIGNQPFIDKNIQFHQLPPALFGAQWLQAPYNGAHNIKFNAPSGVDVYVAVDKNIAAPAGLQSFENTNTEIVTDENGGRAYQVLKKRLGPESSFGLTLTDSNLIAWSPISNMQPAFDLKPINSYKSTLSVTSRGVEKKVIMNAERDQITANDPVQISWPVKTGVADSYAVTLKYFSPEGKDIPATIEMTDINGKQMLFENFSFKLTREGKWNNITFTTPGMINAGYYTVTVKTKDARGVVISNIDIQ